MISSRRIILERNWRLRSVSPAEQADLAARQLPASANARGWLPAHVPGCVHSDLFAAGQIPNPLSAQAGVESAWVENQDFLYQTPLVLPADWEAWIGRPNARFLLSFESLETFAHVYLNGHYLGASENQFLPASFDVSDSLRSGDNVLTIHFESALRHATEAERENGRLEAHFDRPRVHLRRMQSLTGWTVMPRLSGAGIWGKVAIELVRDVRILDLYVPTKRLSGNEARVAIETELEVFDAITVDIETTIERLEAVTGAEVVRRQTLYSETKQRDLKVGRLRNIEVVDIQDPVLWWPAGIGRGRRSLYGVNVIVRDPGGEILAESRRTIGLRHIELITQDEEGQPCFRLEVNGRPVFARGAVWITPAVCPSGRSPERIRELLEQAAAANINFLRVWGGGVYESDEFYDRCDELGIMVWQEFPFASGLYPTNKDFWKNAQYEVRAQIRRLRNHASLAVWCGNEGVNLHYGNSDPSHRKLFEKLFPTVLATYDPRRSYWPSSPSGGSTPNDPAAGDYHLPEGKTASEPRVAPRFVSSFGFPSLPCAETIRRFTPEQDLTLNHEDYERHREPNAVSLIFDRIRDTARAPRTFEELIYLSQWLQGSELAATIARWRASSPVTMGAVVRHFADPVAAMTSSVIDARGEPKLSYWFLREAFAPEALLLLPASGGVRVVALSAEATKDPGREYVIRLKTYRLNGELLAWLDREAVIGADGRAEIGYFGWDDLRVTTPSNTVVVGELCAGEKMLASALHQPVVPRDAAFEEPALAVKLDFVFHGRRAVYYVRSANVVRGVEVRMEGVPGAIVRYENAFDIWPSREVWIQVDLSRDVDEQALLEGLRFRCLNDLVGGRTIDWRSVTADPGDGLSSRTSDDRMIPLARVRMSDIVPKLSLGESEEPTLTSFEDDPDKTPITRRND